MWIDGWPSIDDGDVEEEDGSEAGEVDGEEGEESESGGLKLISSSAAVFAIGSVILQ